MRLRLNAMLALKFTPYFAFSTITAATDTSRPRLRIVPALRYWKLYPEPETG